MPQRLIELARGDHSSLDQAEREIVLSKKLLVEPGDLVLVKTPNMFYDAMRKLYATEHDHMIVMVDEDRCLHITYPKAKLVPILPFLH